MAALHPTFDPPKRWKREDLSQHQYLQLLSSLTSFQPINNSSAILMRQRQQEATSSPITRRVGHIEKLDSFDEEDDGFVSVVPSSKRPRVDHEKISGSIAPEERTADKLLGLFDGAIEVDFSSIERNVRSVSVPKSIDPVTSRISTNETAKPPIMKSKGKSLFSKLLNSGDVIDLLDDRDGNEMNIGSASFNAQAASHARADSCNAPNPAKSTSLGKLLAANNIHPSSGKGKQTNQAMKQNHTSAVVRPAGDLTRELQTRQNFDRLQPPQQHSAPKTRKGKDEDPKIHDQVDLSLTEFDGIHFACRNAGATPKGLEALVQRLLTPSNPALSSVDLTDHKKLAVSLSFLYKDMTSNHVTSSVKYCTPSTNSSCRLWYCSCDRNARSHVLSSSLIGVIMSIPTPDEDASQQPRTNSLPFFLPLAMCIEPDSKESWRLDFGIQLPIQCETTLADRWKAFHQILSSSQLIKIIYNMQVALLPVVAALENWNSTSSTGYEWIHMFPTIFDPKIAEYLLNSDASEESLELLELQVKYQVESVATDNVQGPSMGIVAKNIAQLSNDLEVLSSLYVQQVSRMSEQRLLALYWEVECPTACLLSNMELHGVWVNELMFKTMKDQLEDAIARITKQIYECSGFKFNISSPEQVSHVLFEKLQLHLTANTATTSGRDVVPAVAAKKFPSTSEEELKKIVNAHAVVPLILEYRSLTKLLSTYIEGMFPFVIGHTPISEQSGSGKLATESRQCAVHAYWNQTSVRTGRLSCCKPNLQNIPGEQTVQGIKYNIRSLFQPRPHFILVAADYSQIEMRILAHVSGDVAMCDLFRSEGDIYRLLAAKILKKSPDQVADDERTRAKVICLGVLYGMGPHSAAAKLGIDVVTASKITNSFFNNFSQVKAWIHRVKSLAKDVGHVKTIMGRVRQLADINNTTDSSKRSAAERQAVNSIIQGSASDLIKYSMILSTQKLFALSPTVGDRKNDLPCSDTVQHLGPPRLIMQIHDELIFEVAASSPSYVDHVITALSQVMENDIAQSLQFRVPLLVNVSVGRNWGEMETWKQSNSHEILEKFCGTNGI